MADYLREACQLCWDGDAKWANCLTTDRLRLPDAAAYEVKASIEACKDTAMSAADLYQQAHPLVLNAYSAADIREYGMMEDVDVPSEAEIEEALRAVNLEQEKMKAEQEVQAAEDEAEVVQQMTYFSSAEIQNPARRGVLEVADSAADIREDRVMEDVADVPAEAEIEEVLRAVNNLEQEKMKAEQEVLQAESEAGMIEVLTVQAEQAERQAQEAHKAAEKEAKAEEDKLLQEEKKCEQAAEDLRKLEKEAEQLKKDKDNLEQKQNEAQRELEELQAAERRTKEEWDKIKKEQEGIKSKIKQLEVQMATLQKDIASLKAAIKKHDAEIADCERKLEKANQAIRRLQAKIKELKGQMEKHKADIKKNTEAREKRDHMAKDFEMQAQQLEEEAARLDAKAADALKVAAAAAWTPIKGDAAMIAASIYAGSLNSQASEKRIQATRCKSRAKAERTHAEGHGREVSRLEGEKRKAATRQKKAEASLAEERGNVSRLTEERKVLKTNRSAACDKEKGVQKRHDASKVSEVRLKTKLSTMHWSKEEVQSRLRGVESEMKNTKDRMTKVDGQMKDVDNSRNVKRDEQSAARSLADKQSSKWQEAQTRVASATAVRNERSLEASRVRANSDAASVNKAARQSRLNSLTARLLVAKSVQLAQATAPARRAQATAPATRAQATAPARRVR